MLASTAVAVVVAALLWWLKKTVTCKKYFTVGATVSKHHIFEFLRTPANLARTHPTIKKVSDIRKDKEALSFHIEEDFGPLFGKKEFSMKLIASSDTSPFTSNIRIEHSSSIADVTVNLDVCEEEDDVGGAGDGRLQHEPLVTVRACTSVTTWRLLIPRLSTHVADVWHKTVENTINLIAQQTDS